MANGTPAGGFDVQALLGNPLFNIGAGLLVSGLSGPQNVGQGLGRGLQFGLQQQNLVARNNLLRERLTQTRQQQAERAKRQDAVQRLAGLLSGGEVLTPQQGDPDDLEPTTVAPSRGEIIGLLGEIAPGALAQGLLSQVLPQPVQPTTFMRDFAFLEGKNMSGEQILATLKKGTTVNVGNLDKPLSPSDLQKIRVPGGGTLPIGTTPRQAAEAGATVLTSSQIKALDSADKFSGVLDRLDALALDESSGVFTNVQPGFGNRVRAGLDLFISSLERETERDKNVAEFESLAQGTIAPIIRQLGDSGALSDGDVGRALGLLPQIRGEFLLPDTQEGARRKLETLREILERGEKKLRSNLKGNSRTTPRSERVIDFNDL